MKRFVPLSLLLLTLLGSVNAYAQPAPPRPGGGGRDFEDRRAQRQERRAEPGPGQGGRGAQEGRESDRQRMSPEERRALRDQIRDHGREIYHPPHRR